MAVIVVGWLLSGGDKVNSAPSDTSNKQRSSVPAVPTSIETRPINKKAQGARDPVDVATVHFRQGKFYLDESLRFYFEYFILQRGDLTDAQLVGQLKHDASQRYSEKTAVYLLELFERYLQYLDAMAANNNNSGESLGYQEITRIQRGLQQGLFNEQEQKALFSDAYLEKYSDQHVLQGKYQRYQEQAKPLDDAQELDALRTEMFGLEAAARFKALEQERSLWQQRLQQYYCAKKMIEASPGIADEDKHRQINALQERSFKGPELTRARALDAQDALSVDKKNC